MLDDKILMSDALTPDRRLIHGILFLVIISVSLIFPQNHSWPWLWLVPLILYFSISAFTPSLRCSLNWIRIGTPNVYSIACALALMAITASILLLYQAYFNPDLSTYPGLLHLNALGGYIISGVIFCLMNAIMEELIFRGVLYDAIRSQWGIPVTLIATSFLFGLGHLSGYPPGPVGAILAGIFGIGMGILRIWTNGLFLPIFAHIGADATIYYIIISNATVS